MEMLKSMTLAACFISLGLSAASQLVAFEKYAAMLKIIFTSVLVLCVAKPVLSAGFINFSFFDSNQNAEYDYAEANKVIDEAVRLQTKQSLEETACRLLTEYEIDFKDLSLDVNIDEQGCISISKVSLKSDSPLTVCYALKKVFGDNTEIEVLEYE